MYLAWKLVLSIYNLQLSRELHVSISFTDSSRVREENPGCARRTQGARGESRESKEYPGCASKKPACASRIQGT
jgi:hypothetical protein